MCKKRTASRVYVRARQRYCPMAACLFWGSQQASCQLAVGALAPLSFCGWSAVKPILSGIVRPTCSKSFACWCFYF
eukprot:20148-Eustigmatos_ZCMA.PRE.1